MRGARLEWAAAPLLLIGLVAATLLAMPSDPPVSAGGSREVTDDAGRRVRFEPGGPRALYMAVGAGEYLLTTRAAQRLVTSRSPDNERLLASSLLRRAVPKLGTTRLALTSSEGAAANLETLLQLRPDVMVTWSRLVPRFERVGIRSVGLGPMSDAASFARHARVFGQVTGEQARSEAIVRASAERTRRIASEVAASGAPSTRVLFVFPTSTGWRSSYEFADTIEVTRADDLTGALSFYSPLDRERLLKIAPDVIVIVGGARIDDDAAARLMADPILAALPAVRARRVYRHPPGIGGYMASAVELPIYQRWLAEVLHPAQLRSGTRPLAAEVIRADLGVEPTDAELDEILGTVPNHASAEAGRFEATPR